MHDHIIPAIQNGTGNPIKAFAAINETMTIFRALTYQLAGFASHGSHHAAAYQQHDQSIELYTTSCAALCFISVISMSIMTMLNSINHERIRIRGFLYSLLPALALLLLGLALVAGHARWLLEEPLMNPFVVLTNIAPKYCATIPPRGYLVLYHGVPQRKANGLSRFVKRIYWIIPGTLEAIFWAFRKAFWLIKRFIVGAYGIILQFIVGAYQFAHQGIVRAANNIQ